jgi:DNA-binding response OmpR family regulator
MKILLVEDVVELATAIKNVLEKKSYTVDIVTDGEKALSRISLHRTDYDLIILDLSLPKLDGYEVCKAVRLKEIAIPILVLTAKKDPDMKVKMLMLGADDYVVKPFMFDELHARVHALLRRPKTMLAEELKFGALTISPGTHRVTLSGRDVPVTLKEYGLLEYLVRNPNKVVSREDLLARIWDFNYSGFSNVVDVHIKNLRRKLKEQSGQSVVETIRGIGYRISPEFAAPVHTSSKPRAQKEVTS